MNRITSVAELEELYGAPSEAALVKEVDHITPHYRDFIEAAPFVILATAGPEGLDCSPRGDNPGFVRVHNEKTVMMPDRRGNNRADSLKNIIRDPRVSLLFLIPGSGSTLRINGRAYLTDDADLLDSFAVQEKAPRSVVVVETDAVYFQCAKAIVRSGLWESENKVDPGSLPSPGQMLAALTSGRFDGEAFDREAPERLKQTLW